MIARPYRAEDRAACLAIFDGNVPKFFAPDERADFVTFLDRPERSEAPYLVLEEAGAVIACGGLTPGAAPGAVHLSWGMVTRGRQRDGIGTRLTEARLALARAMPGVTKLHLETSQHGQGFYARFGFILTRVIPDGFGPGLDRWDMVRPLP